MAYLMVILSIAMAVSAEVSSVVVPNGTVPEIDGRILADEWDDAQQVDFAGGRGLLMKQSGQNVYVAIRGMSGGIGSIGLCMGDTLCILHASTGLITARYSRSGGSWRRVSGFDGPTNDEGHNFARGPERQSAAYLAANLRQFGWQANVVESGPPEEMEYQIDVSRFAENTARLSVVFLQIRAEQRYAVAPTSLNDASLNRELIAGTAPDSLQFETSTWLSLEW